MSGGRYDERVRDLLEDAEHAAASGDWGAVRDLAGAVLALVPGHVGAERILEQAAAAAPSAGERRQLTVMFCDVVGSTALSQEHDPELVREVLRSYQVTCDRVVRRYEGRIARFIGDGILAYFGVPVAHEDDARRGVKAGLDLLEALRPVVEEVRERYEVDLRIRVAVHTGLVVRGDMGSATTPDRDAIVGEVPNVAARLQDHAEPGTLLISHDTFELVRPWFLVAPRGALVLKGIDEPVLAYQVVEESPVESRVRAQADLSPFVGRTAEVEVLTAAWAEAQAGASAVVAITGQPGVGKSRLVDVLRRRVEAEEGTVLALACSPYHRATALHPMRRLLERVAGIDPHQHPDLALPKLWAAMEAVGRTEALPVLADLLELPATSWCPAPELDGPKLREQLMAQLQRWVEALASRGPLLLVAEDVQWSDPTTVELLGSLVGASVPGLLVAATLRDDAKVPWAGVTEVALDRLSPDELADLARRLPEGRRLDRAHLEQVIERSDGIPLYLEELLRSSRVAQGDGGYAPSAIPPALRDLLLARFAAPGVDLRTAQVLATIGGEAPLPLVARASDLPLAQLDQQLAALVDANIVTVEPGEVLTYRFRHHLLAELAYDTQLQAVRRAAHGAVADVLLGGHPEVPEAAPAVLAHHLERAGRPSEAITYLTAAAEDANGLGANAEVAELLAHAFALVEGLPTALRSRHEFELRLLRGNNAASIMGYAAPQAVEDFTACRDLVRLSASPEAHVDEPEVAERHAEEVVWSGAGLWATFMLQARLGDAHAVNRSLVAALQPGTDLHRYFDVTRSYVDFFEGDYAAAIAGLEECEQLYPRIHIPGTMALPSDPGVTQFAHRAFALQMQCRDEDARTVSDEGLALARSMPFPRGPFSVCYLGGMRSAVEQIAGDSERAHHFAGMVTEVAERHGYTFWTIVAGFEDALIDLAAGVEGAAQRCEMSLMLIEALGIVVWLPCWIGSVAEELMRQDQPAQARPLVDRALALAEANGAHYWTGMLLRQDGVLRLLEGDERGIDQLEAAVARSVASAASLPEMLARAALVTHRGDEEDRRQLAALMSEVGATAPPRMAAIAWEALG